MKKILFVCLGNICRSPTAEGVFLQMLEEKKLSHQFLIDSAGTIGNHQGELPDERTRKSAKKRGIDLVSHSRKIEIADLEKFDFILCMDQSNVEDVKKLDPRKLHHSKIKLFTDFRLKLNFTEVPDPYYGTERDFDLVVDIVLDSCRGFFEKELKLS
jgi:protein-tyrosine phosphatase